MITIYFLAADDNAAAAVLSSGPEDGAAVESEVDPVALASLEAALTDRDIDDLLSDDDYPRMVAEDDGRSVVVLDAPFVRALSQADLDRALADWLESEDVEGADPDEAADFLTDLQQLCIEAGRDQQVYCWVAG